ncbi:hypothetical protein [Roseomonas sp. 18066]|uniref:hypothetical protein n=1 Tax=Roseomonas sp. 18066 TaxID=2681412 RepID=UPI001356AE2A|nr:hypothetical protein [Roseomonas sp. 18066]
MNDADRQALEAHLINKAHMEILSTAQRMQQAQVLQAAQIDQLTKVLPAIASTLTEMTELLRTLSQDQAARTMDRAGASQQKPAPQAGGAVLALVPASKPEAEA